MKNNFICILFLASLFPSSSNAQIGFQNRYEANGNVRFYSVSEMENEDLLFGGSILRTTPLGLSDTPLLLKTNSLGEIDWSKSANFSLQIKSVERHSTGKYVVSGRMPSGSLGGPDIFLGLVDENGDFEWMKAVGGSGGDYGEDIAVYPNGDILVSGYHNTEGRVAKITATGDLIWSHRYNLAGTNDIFGIITTVDGGSAFCGRTTSIPGAGDNDWWVAKLNTIGDVEWSKSYGGFQLDLMYDIIQVPSGGFVLAGSMQNVVFEGNNAVLIYTDSSGNVEWAKAFGTDSDDRGNSVMITDQGYRLVGLSDTIFNNGGFMIVDVDQEGDVISSKLFGDEVSDKIVETNQSAIITSSDETIIAGWVQLNNVEYGFALRINENDETGCNETEFDVRNEFFTPIVGVGSHQKFPTGQISDITINWVPITVTSSYDCVTNNISEEKRSELRVFPNPTANQVTVQSEGKVSSVKLYDLMGLERSISISNNQIDLNELKTGIYFLLLETEDGARNNIKVVKK